MLGEAVVNRVDRVNRRRWIIVSSEVLAEPAMALDLIDTHAHLDDDRFRDDLAAVLDRARQAGVGRVITIATTGPSSVRCVELARRHASLSATVGVQPNEAAQAA